MPLVFIQKLFFMNIIKYQMSLKVYHKHLLPKNWDVNSSDDYDTQK